MSFRRKTVYVSFFLAYSDAMQRKEETQLERFKEAAKQAETDQSDDALDKVFDKLDLKREAEKEDKNQGEK